MKAQQEEEEWASKYMTAKDFDLFGESPPLMELPDMRQMHDSPTVGPTDGDMTQEHRQVSPTAGQSAPPRPGNF